jgi:hypothetical protein
VRGRESDRAPFFPKNAKEILKKKRRFGATESVSFGYYQ